MIRRSIIYVVIASVSILLLLMFDALLPDILWVRYLLLALVGGGLYLLYERVLWRYLPFHVRDGEPFERPPDLAGDWHVRLTSVRNDSSRIDEAQIHITQTASQLIVRFENDVSTSYNYATTIFKDRGQHVLAYIYRSQPKDDAPEGVLPHTGLCVVRQDDNQQWSGYYHYFQYDENNVALIRGQFMITREAGADLPVITPKR